MPTLVRFYTYGCFIYVELPTDSKIKYLLNGKSHFIFIYNVTNKCLDVLHSIGLCVLYRTICVTLKKNAKRINMRYSLAQSVFYIFQ